MLSAVQLKKKEVNRGNKKINGLQAKLECKQDLIMQEESETLEIFSDLYDS